MNDKAITKTNGKELDTFGGRDDIREMAERLQKMMPGTSNFTATEALTVAQVAIAHDLDPFNGEVWGLKSDKTGKWYGVMVGIKGLRKKAREQAAEEDGSFWTEFRRVDPGEYHAQENAVVYECHLRDTVHVQAWSQSINSMTRVGVPYERAIEALGPAPVVVGVGIATPNEQSKMDLHSRARKRAEADAIKQRYDVKFKGAKFDMDYEPNGDTIAGEFEELDSPSVAHKKSADQAMKELGYEPDEEAPEPFQQDDEEIEITAKDWQEFAYNHLSVADAKEMLEACGGNPGMAMDHLRAQLEKAS